MSRGKPRLSVRDISRTSPTPEEMRSIVEALTGNSPPIVVAILGAALIEHDLEQLLRPRFNRKDDTSWARLTGDNGPIGTLNQKIIAAHAFSIIDDDTRKCLGTLKDIRNAFAHSKKLITFEHELITAKMRGLPQPAAKKSAFAKDLKRVREFAKTNTRGAFIVLCLVLSNRLSAKRTARAKVRIRRLDAKIRRKNLLSAVMVDLALGRTPKPYRGLSGGSHSGYPKDQESPQPQTYAEKLYAKANEAPFGLLGDLFARKD